MLNYGLKNGTNDVLIHFGQNINAKKILNGMELICLIQRQRSSSAIVILHHPHPQRRHSSSTSERMRQRQGAEFCPIPQRQCLWAQFGPSLCTLHRFKRLHLEVVAFKVGCLNILQDRVCTLFILQAKVVRIALLQFGLLWLKVDEFNLVELRAS